MWLCARACDCVRECCVPECYAHVCTWALGLWLFFQDASGTSPASGLERKGVCAHSGRRGRVATPALLSPPTPKSPRSSPLIPSPGASASKQEHFIPTPWPPPVLPAGFLRPLAQTSLSFLQYF